jgi:hypothetical protein
MNPSFSNTLLKISAHGTHVDDFDRFIDLVSVFASVRFGGFGTTRLLYRCREARTP